MAVKGVKVESVVDFAQHVLDDFGRHGSNFVYRGVPAANYPLSNTLQRRVVAASDAAFRQQEAAILTEFARRAQGFGYTRSKGLGHLIALAQHHGLPTRFLDWTFSGLTALHFALDDAAGDAAVWRLDWKEMHRLYAPEGRPSHAPLDIEELDRADRDRGQLDYDVASLVDRFRAPGVGDDPDERPHFAALVMLPYLHPRIAAQQGAFVVWTDPMQALEDFLAANHSVKRLLTKFVISKRAVPRMRAELRHLGVTETSVWPDLDGAARDAAAAVSPR